jgi:tetratricopeptide (TPR) repeat protein
MACRELLAIAVLLGAGRAIADDTAPGVDPVDHRLTERLTRLAEHHYRAGAYYRAISAYEELALFTDDDATRRYAAIRIAMSYHHGHQLDDALPAYRAALALTHDGDTAQALRIQVALARVERSFDEPGAEAFDAIAAELAPSTAAGGYRALALVQHFIQPIDVEVAATCLVGLIDQMRCALEDREMFAHFHERCRLLLRDRRWGIARDDVRRLPQRTNRNSRSAERGMLKEIATRGIVGEYVRQICGFHDSKSPFSPGEVVACSTSV